MTNHVNVVIATPGHSLMGQYVNSLLSTLTELSKKNITWAFSNKYCSHVGDAREITIGGEDPQDASDSRPFKGELTYDKIIWIDSDIAWTPEDFIKLYESDKDIISGAYLLQNGQVVAYKKVFEHPYSYEEVLKMTDPVKVHSVGFGFVAIKQGVFEKLSRPWFQQTTTSVKNEDGSTYSFPVMGEDMSFCIRASNAGFDIWLDPTVKVTHHKMMTLSWQGVKP